jgi:hypothetical protein
MCAKSQESLPRYFSHLEEARKSWENCISDKFIHFEQVADPQVGSLSPFTKEYFNGNAWIELYLRLKFERYLDYQVIIESRRLSNDSGVGIELKQPITNHSMGSDVPMLFNVPEIMESPKVIGFEGVSTIVRLKRPDHGDRNLRNSEGFLGDFNLSFDGIPFVNGEADSLRRSVTVEQGELPSKVIEGRPQRINEVGMDKCNLISESVIGREFKADDVISMLNVVIRNNLVMVRIFEDGDFFCQSVQMFFRPFHFEFRIEDARHSQGVYCFPVG